MLQYIVLYIYIYIYIYIYNIYTSFPCSSDSGLIQMSMFNCITDFTEWLSHNSLFLNTTTTDTIIFSRPSSPLSITRPFLLSVPTYQSITTLGFTITCNLMYKRKRIQRRAMRVLYKLNVASIVSISALPR